MKVAIIHDDLMRRGGAEKVALAFHRMFPAAPIYTLCYRPELTYAEFKRSMIITSFINRFVWSENLMKWSFFPFGYWAMRRLKVENYDCVIISSTFAAKYANIRNCKRVIHYCHNPFRLVWYPESYNIYTRLKFPFKIIFDSVLSTLRRIDFKHARNFDITLVNSELVKSRVLEKYKIEADCVINPPVELDFSHLEIRKSDYYLVVSRLESYKMVDLVVETFNANGRKLVVVGNGSQKEFLMSKARNNIHFLSNLSNDELFNIYAGAIALIFPQVEDFGITPLEANAAGTVVLAYGKGGVLETIIPYPQNGCTGMFFDTQDQSSINNTIDEFERNKLFFKKENLLINANRFGQNVFAKKISEFLPSN